MTHQRSVSAEQLCRQTWHLQGKFTGLTCRKEETFHCLEHFGFSLANKGNPVGCRLLTGQREHIVMNFSEHERRQLAEGHWQTVHRVEEIVSSEVVGVAVNVQQWCYKCKV